MKRFGIAVLAALLVASAGRSVLAQATEHTAEMALNKVAPEDQPTQEQLTRLFEVMRLRQQMESMMKSMTSMMQQQISQQIRSMASSLPNGGAVSAQQQQQQLDRVLNKYTERVVSLYPVSEMVDDMLGLYRRHLSREDVDAFIAFYSSPAGQHLLDAQPAIMQEYLPLVSQRMQTRSKTLTDEMMKDMDQLSKPNNPEK
jgi:hypothetical protein